MQCTQYNLIRREQNSLICKHNVSSRCRLLHTSSHGLAGAGTKIRAGTSPQNSTGIRARIWDVPKSRVCLGSGVCLLLSKCRLSKCCGSQTARIVCDSQSIHHCCNSHRQSVLGQNPETLVDTLPLGFMVHIRVGPVSDVPRMLGHPLDIGEVPRFLRQAEKMTSLANRCFIRCVVSHLVARQASMTCTPSS
jgi:hypothetical protein